MLARLTGVLQVQMPEHGAGILWIDGKVDRLLAPGSYAFWPFGRNVSVDRVDLRLQAQEVTGMKGIVLPDAMKTILALVVEAGKAAEANVIRRLEQTAAMRSLPNAAKVMEGKAVALRIKELDTLERMAERIDRISVVGGPDQLLNGLVKLRWAPAPAVSGPSQWRTTTWNPTTSTKTCPAACR